MTSMYIYKVILSRAFTACICKVSTYQTNALTKITHKILVDSLHACFRSDLIVPLSHKMANYNLSPLNIFNGSLLNLFSDKNRLQII